MSSYRQAMASRNAKTLRACVDELPLESQVCGTSVFPEHFTASLSFMYPSHVVIEAVVFPLRGSSSCDRRLRISSTRGGVELEVSPR